MTFYQRLILKSLSVILKVIAVEYSHLSISAEPMRVKIGNEAKRLAKEIEETFNKKPTRTPQQRKILGYTEEKS